MLLASVLSATVLCVGSYGAMRYGTISHDLSAFATHNVFVVRLFSWHFVRVLEKTYDLETIASVFYDGDTYRCGFWIFTQSMIAILCLLCSFNDISQLNLSQRNNAKTPRTLTIKAGHIFNSQNTVTCYLQPLRLMEHLLGLHWGYDHDYKNNSMQVSSTPNVYGITYRDLQVSRWAPTQLVSVQCCCRWMEWRMHVLRRAWTFHKTIICSC